MMIKEYERANIRLNNKNKYEYIRKSIFRKYSYRKKHGINYGYNTEREIQ